jgi:hypothetical protein
VKPPPDVILRERGDGWPPVTDAGARPKNLVATGPHSGPCREGFLRLLSAQADSVMV